MSNGERSPSRPRRVLLLEDEAKLRRALERSVSSMGFEVESSGSVGEARAMAAQQEFDIALLDLKLPDGDGLECYERLRERWPFMQGVVLTGYGSLAAAQRAFKLETVDFLSKPFLLQDVQEALERAWRKRMNALELAGHATLSSREAAPASSAEAHRLEDLEQEHILGVLQRHHGNRVKTAKELGISLRTLYYRLSNYKSRGIDVDNGA